MRRKWLLVTIGAALLGLLTLMYSLVGAMTGVYACPAMKGIVPGNGYFVRRGDSWYLVGIGNESLVPYVEELDRAHFDIKSGIWIVTVTERGGGETVRAFTPWNLADVYRLTFGNFNAVGRTPGWP